jgi:transcriptional regulator with XRE-family HTH domain
LNYKKLEFLQREKGVSLEKLGVVVGITGAGFKRMLIKKTCSVAYIEKIADYFNVPIEYFFDDADLTINSILEANKMLDSGNNILIKHLLKDKANLEMLVEKLVEENERLKMVKTKVRKGREEVQV